MYARHSATDTTTGETSTDTTPTRDTVWVVRIRPARYEPTLDGGAVPLTVACPHCGERQRLASTAATATRSWTTSAAPAAASSTPGPGPPWRGPTAAPRTS